MLVHLQENDKKTWTVHVIQLICTYGIGELWFQQVAGDVGAFFSLDKGVIYTCTHKTLQKRFCPESATSSCV